MDKKLEKEFQMSEDEIRKFIWGLAIVVPEMPIPKGGLYRLTGGANKVRRIIDDMMINEKLPVETTGKVFKFGEKIVGLNKRANRGVAGLMSYPPWVVSIVDEFLALQPDLERRCMTNRMRREWEHAVFTCHKVEGYSPEDIKAVVLWAKQHSFWGKIFLSLAKLRRHSATDDRLYVNRWMGEMRAGEVKEPVMAQHVRALLGKVEKEVDKTE